MSGQFCKGRSVLPARFKFKCLNALQKRIIVLYGWKVNVQEQNKIVGELHIPRENFTFPRS